MIRALFIICALFSFDVSLASVSPETEGRGRWFPGFKGVIRSKRQVCEHGIYQHNNRDCCLCGAGQWMKTHCTASIDDGKCELCGHGTYNSDPNSAPSCELCTSCSHINANLEVREPCTPDSDTTCKCKEHHYCSSGTEATCRLCNLCKVCDKGIKEPCTATSDTLCSDKSEGGNLSVIIPIVVVVLLVIIGIAFGVFWKRKQQRKAQLNIESNGNATDMELQPLRDVDLSPHLHDIATVLGWKDMTAVAMRTRVENNAIENCRLDHPGNAHEQTIELLKIWVEQQGRNASNKLIEILKSSEKRAKAEKVAALLTGDSGD